MRSVISVLFGLVAVVTAKEPDYFPLQGGNMWVYRCAQSCLPGETLKLEVVGIADATAPDGSAYYLLRGLAKDFWVRTIDFSRLVARDPEGSAEEKLWYNFGAPEKEEYATSVHPCNFTAKITSKKFDYRGPIALGPALRIEYPASACDLQGLTEELFLPNIGLARRTDLVGTRTYELIFAHVNGFSFVPPSEVSFGLSLDRAVYSPGLPGTPVSITARITLKNTSPDSIHLSLPQNPYDLEIKDKNGEVLYRWSEAQASQQQPIEIDLEARDLNYIMIVPLEFGSLRTMPAGAYTAEARLTTVTAESYTASVSFQITR